MAVVYVELSDAEFAALDRTAEARERDVEVEAEAGLRVALRDPGYMKYIEQLIRDEQQGEEWKRM